MILTSEPSPITESPGLVNPTPLGGSLDRVTPIAEALGFSGPEAGSTEQLWVDAMVAVTDQARNAADRYPDSPVMWARLAQAAVISGQLDDAIAAARRSVELQPASHDSKAWDLPALLVATTVLAMCGENARAEEALREAPRDPALAVVAASLRAESEDWKGALALLDGVESSTAASLRGWVLLELGSHQAALSALRKSVAQFGEDPTTAANMAFAFSALGSLKKAVRSARTATTLAPLRRDLSLGLVAYLAKAGELQAARTEVARTAGIQGADLQTAMVDAMIAWRQTGAAEAVRLLKRARRERLGDAGNVTAADVSGVIRILEFNLGEHSRTSTVTYLRRLVDGAKVPSKDLAVMAARMMSTREISSFVPRVLDRGEFEDPDPIGWELRYRLARATGDIPAASSAVKRWASLTPLQPLAATEHVLMLALADGDFEAAANEAARALRAEPEEALLRNNSALVLALAGRARAAASALPKHPEDLAVHSATTGLVSFSSGDLQGGYDGYIGAVRIAEEAQRPDVARFKALVSLYYNFALDHFDLRAKAAAAGLAIDFAEPSDAADDMSFSLLRYAQDRARTSRTTSN